MNVSGSKVVKVVSHISETTNKILIINVGPLVMKFSKKSIFLSNLRIKNVFKTFNYKCDPKKQEILLNSHKN